MLLLFALVSWVGSTYAAHALGTRKGRHNCWLWGFLVGWIGVVVVACLGPRYEKRNTRPPGEDQRWAELVRTAAGWGARLLARRLIFTPAPLD